MKSIVSCNKALRISLFSFQLRFYKGKYLTSYQKRISTDEKKFHPIEHNPEPLQIVVEHSLKDKYVTKPEVITKEDDLYDIYRSSSDEYRNMIFYGSEDKSISKSDFYCHGCGSNINCASMNNPGYIPIEIYSQNFQNKDFMKDILCIRCFYLANEINPLDVSLDAHIYSDLVLNKLKEESSATVIVLADLTDLPWSIPSNLHQFCLPNIRLIIIGNKLDLMPQKGHLKNGYKSQLINAAEQRGIKREAISFVELLSATDCTGIDTLIDRLLSLKFYKNEPIYLIGSTNVGKSTIFNRFLKSDLCKTIAKGQIKDALISNWPGTTLNVLRFPMVNVSTALLTRRVSAKYALSRREIESAVGGARDGLLDSNQLIVRSRQSQDAAQLPTYSFIGGRIQSNCLDEEKMRRLYDDGQGYDVERISERKWCYDTPGLINPDQLINYLPKAELDSLADTSGLSVPRIYVLKNGLSIIMQNLARLDVVEAPGHVYLVVHGVLPVEIVDTWDIDRYLRENEHITHYSCRSGLSGPLLDRVLSQVPLHSGGTLLPALVPLDMSVETSGFMETSADVVLSSVGWVGVSGREGAVCKLTAWTPASIGCCLRTPSMVPGAVRRRQYRKTHSREFVVT